MNGVVMICDRARNKFSLSGQPFYGYVICSLYCWWQINYFPSTTHKHLEVCFSTQRENPHILSESKLFSQNFFYFSKKKQHLYSGSGLIYKATLSGIENGDDMETLTFLLYNKTIEFHERMAIRFLGTFFFFIVSFRRRFIISFLFVGKNGKFSKKKKKQIQVTLQHHHIFVYKEGTCVHRDHV